MASTILITSSMGSARLGLSSSCLTSIGSLAAWMTMSEIGFGSFGPAKSVFEMRICCS